jgi:hypothetical protein
MTGCAAWRVAYCVYVSVSRALYRAATARAAHGPWGMGPWGAGGGRQPQPQPPAGGGVEAERERVVVASAGRTALHPAHRHRPAKRSCKEVSLLLPLLCSFQQQPLCYVSVSAIYSNVVGGRLYRYSYSYKYDYMRLYDVYRARCYAPSIADAQIKTNRRNLSSPGRHSTTGTGSPGS